MKVRQGGLWLGLGAATWAAIAFGSAVSAQTAPPYQLYEGVTVAPATVTAPGQEVNISGPGFPGASGCRFGKIQAVPQGGQLADASLVTTADLDQNPWSVQVDGFATGPFTSGTFNILLDCTDDGGVQQVRSTTATLTVTESATVTTLPPASSSTTSSTSASSSTSSTSTPVNPQGDGQGTVDPTSAKPGVTELTIRGGGFVPGQELQISLGSAPELVVARTQSTATGTYAALLKLPLNAPPGEQRLRVSGPGVTGGTHASDATVTVTDLDCSDFPTPAAAQVALGVAGTDPHGLDADGDGEACGAAGAASAGRARSGAAPAGTLAKTGGRFTPAEIAVGLSAVVLGALLAHLPHLFIVPGDPSVLPGHRAQVGDRPSRRGRHRARRRR